MAGGIKRDPLSVKYDVPVRRALVAATEAHAQRRAAEVWVGSPPVQFRAVDKGGRTANERAFTRAAYYQVREVPKLNGEPIYWSLQLRWSPIYKRKGRWGRICYVRLRRYYAGARHSRTAGRRDSYAQNAPLRSSVAERVDGPGPLG
jgi:hypothetical protein